MSNGASPQATRELSRLLGALKEEKEYPLSGLYEIDYQAFELAIDVLRDWRVDRYYARNADVLPGFGKDAAKAELAPAD